MKYVLAWMAAGAIALGAAVAEHPTGKTQKTEEHPTGKAGKTAEHSHAKTGEQATITGEVVDTHCYLSDEKNRGQAHAKCGVQCAEMGIPLSLLTDKGEMYLLLGSHAKTANQMALEKKLVGQKATVTGRAVRKGGLQALMVSKLEAAQ